MDKDYDFSLNIPVFYLNNFSPGRPKPGARHMSDPQEGCFITVTLQGLCCVHLEYQGIVE